MTKVLFLDVDGVLLPIGACTDLEVGLVRSSPLAHLDLVAYRVSKEAIEAVQYMCKGGAKIVLISSWRYAFTVNFIHEFLTRIGLNELLHEDWFAGFKPTSGKRDDIGFWLDDHPDVTRWLAIDDQDLGLDRHRQVIPKGNVGLTHDDLRRTRREWALEALFREHSLGAAE